MILASKTAWGLQGFLAPSSFSTANPFIGKFFSLLGYLSRHLRAPPSPVRQLLELGSIASLGKGWFSCEIAARCNGLPLTHSMGVLVIPPLIEGLASAGMLLTWLQQVGRFFPRTWMIFGHICTNTTMKLGYSRSFASTRGSSPYSRILRRGVEPPTTWVHAGMFPVLSYACGYHSRVSWAGWFLRARGCSMASAIPLRDS